MTEHDWLNVDGYDDILNSLTLSRPDGSPEYASIRISENQPASESAVFPPVDIWLPSEHLPQLDGLRKLIQKGLADLDHPVSDPLVDSFLPLISLSRAAGREKLARLFSFFRLTSLTQTFVLPFARDDAEEAAHTIMIGDFALKPFQATLKVCAALAAKSPLGMRPSPLEKCDGNWSVERTIESQPYCDVGDRASLVSSEGASLQEDESAYLLSALFYENYLSHYQDSLIIRFITDFRNAQAPHVALGGRFFPIQDVRGLDGCWFLDEWRDASINSSRGVFGTKTVEHGLRPKLSLEFAAFLRTYDFHYDRSVAAANSAKTDRLLSTFAGVLVMAREQAQQERTEVAFLLCCTALECLFVGNKGEPITRTLGRRLGALQSLSHDVSFRKAGGDIQRLYDTRSQFAHEAKPIDSEKLDRLFNLCVLAYRAAVLASLRLQLRGSEADGESEHWIGKWHKILDYIGSALDAGMTVDGNAAATAGIS